MPFYTVPNISIQWKDIGKANWKQIEILGGTWNTIHRLHWITRYYEEASISTNMYVDVTPSITFHTIPKASSSFHTIPKPSTTFYEV